MSGVTLLKVPAGATDQELHAIVEAAGGFERGAVVEVRVAHDPDCPKPSGGACRCEPELRIAVKKRQAP